MADKKYTIDDILRKFNKLEESVEDITCFIKDCCSKIPINVGEGFGIFKRLHKGKWEFKSLLAGNNVTITETNNEIVISSTGGGGSFNCNDLLSCSTSNLPEGSNLYFTNNRAISALTGQNISIFNNNSGYITSSALAPYLTSSTAASTYYPLSNPSSYINLTSLSSGTGISYNNLTGVITNSAPDQTVVLSNGTGISASGTYPNFTITNTLPDQTVVLNNGTGISISGSYPNFTISNSSPSSGGTVTSIQLAAGTGISLSGTNPITTTGTITVTNSAPDQTVTLGTTGTGLSVTGSYPSFTIQNTLPDQTVVLTQGGTTTITGTYPNFTISSADQYTGTVTSFGFTNANGISGVVTNASTTPNLTLSLGAISPTTVNGITLSGSGSLANSGTSSLTGFTGSGTSSGTNTGDQTITLTGDVTGSGTGSFATTISNNAVTYAKMQNVSTTSKLLGSSSTTTPVQEISLGSGLSLSGTTLSATGTGGTVTSVSALTLGTTGTDLSSTVANSTTTPVITLNVPTASATNRGALSSTDWTTFNNKQAALGYTPENVSNKSDSYTLSSSTTYASTKALVDGLATKQATITPAALTKTDDTNVTLTLGGSPSTALLAATSLTLGWTGTLADSRIASAATWNAKIGGSGTTNELAYFSASSTIGSLTTATYPSLTELSYVKGVTSAIQTQINGKQASITTGTTAQYFRGDLSLSTFATDAKTATGVYLVGKTTTGTTVSGTAAETLTMSYLIPANTFQSGDNPEFMFSGRKSGANNTGTLKMYINTSNSISGATQIAQSGALVAATRTTNFERRFVYFSSSTVMNLMQASSVSGNTDAINVSANESDITYDVTQAYYLIISIQLTSASDSYIPKWLMIRNNR